jgi:NAD(P)-dependent dehydrogenase (short-subunit alcohol dehydrogenase family)
MSSDSRAWVVGGAGGIGSSCVQRLTSDGHWVHASDRPDEDITLPGVADRVAEQLAAQGGFSVAVHAIGMSGRRLGDGPVSECTDEAWEEVLRVDLTSAFRFLRACLRHADAGASIVLIGSALATSLDPDFLTAGYRVAKAGLTPLVQAAAFEGTRRGLRVNIVAPGLVDTPMATRALQNPAIQARFPELMPLTSRPTSPSEVADVVAWLAGRQAPQTTGAVIPVDGGWHLQGRNGTISRGNHT